MRAAVSEQQRLGLIDTSIIGLKDKLKTTE